MPKRNQHPPSEASAKRTARAQDVAKGGKTRATQPRSGRSGSDSNAGSDSKKKKKK